MNAADILAQEQSMYTMSYLASKTANKLGGSSRAILRRWLHAMASGRCFECGRDTRLERFPHEKQGSESNDYAHMGHLISRATIERETGEPRGGYVPGNIGIQCKGCNVGNEDNDLNPYQIGHPELVPLSWPSLSRRNPCA